MPVDPLTARNPKEICKALIKQGLITSEKAKEILSQQGKLVKKLAREKGVTAAGLSEGAVSIIDSLACAVPTTSNASNTRAIRAGSLMTSAAVGIRFSSLAGLRAPNDPAAGTGPKSPAPPYHRPTLPTAIRQMANIPIFFI